MQIGAGLEGPAYGATGENAFIDQMEYCGRWLSFNAIWPSPWDTYLSDQIPKDSQGYPNSGIPALTSGGLQKVKQLISANTRVNPGQYVFLYDGYGEFKFQGFTVDSLQAGRIVVTLTGTGNVWLEIDSSSASPNHARNFRLVPYGQENTYKTDVFRPSFLNKVNDFAVIRFMDWFHTNNNPGILWTSRTTKDSYSQTDSGGIAYEHAIELCNLTGKGPWINIPAMADSQYIVNMAQLWLDSLDPNLDLIIEYSNEVWNFQFQQTQWIQQNTNGYPAHWPINSLYNPAKNWAENTGFMQGRAINIFRDVWGADSSRVKRIIGTQSVNSWVSLNNIEGAKRKYDYLSPTWYFGISLSQSAAFDANTTPQQIINTCRNSFFSSSSIYKEHLVIVDSTGGDGIMQYEGGQHISAYGNANHPALQAFYDAQIHPDMYQLYDDVLDSIRSWGSELAMCFTLASTNSQYGSWGHIQSVDSTPSMSSSPKYMALLHNMPILPTPNLGPDSSLCFGGTLLLDPGAGFVSYQWQDTSNSPTFSANSSGTYSVTVTDNWNCVGSDSINLTIHAPAQALYSWIDFLDTISFTDLSAGGVAWYWDFGDGNTSTQQNPSHFYPPNIYFDVCLTATDSNGCQATYCDSVMTNSLSIKEPSLENYSIWPNPVQDNLFIKLENGENEIVRIALLDLFGKNIWQENYFLNTGETIQIEIPQIAKGMYLLELRKGNSRKVEKIIIE